MASHQASGPTQETAKDLPPSLDRSRFAFQNNWFEQIIPEWEALTVSLRLPSTPKAIHILELGSFEGASTTWMLDNLMHDPASTITAIDTFAGGMEHSSTEVDSLYAHFLANVKQCSCIHQLRIMQALTKDALITLRKEGAKFDFIYIDASHVAIDVLHDAVLCWHMLELDGTLVFDDWRWKGYLEDVYNPRIAIMAFLQCAAPEVKVQETKSQMWVTRVQNERQATKNPDPALYYWDNSVKFNVEPSATCSEK